MPTDWKRGLKASYGEVARGLEGMGGRRCVQFWICGRGELDVVGTERSGDRERGWKLRCSHRGASGITQGEQGGGPGQEEASSQGREMAGRVRCYRDFKGIRVWPQKVTVTFRVTFGIERWRWKPSWQELRHEWEVSRERSCKRGGEMRVKTLVGRRERLHFGLGKG